MGCFKEHNKGKQDWEEEVGENRKDSFAQKDRQILILTC